MQRRLRVFVSYSHKDEAWVRDDDRHALIPWLQEALRRDGVEFWSDERLKFDTAEFRDGLDAQIRGADVAVLLLSQDFLISDFIARFELPRIRERYVAGELVVIPIQIGYVSWDGYDEFRWLSDLQIIPGRPTPLVEYVGDEARFNKVKVEILDVFRQRLLTRSDDRTGTRPALPSSRTPIPLVGRDRRRHFRSRALIVALSALLVSAPFAWQFIASSKAVRLEIVDPGDGDEVPHAVKISVTTNVTDAKPWVVVRPKGIDSFWVQEPLVAAGPRTWEGQILLGEPAEEHVGKRYEVRAFALPAKPLAGGRVLSEWPESAIATPAITVVRR